jgi:polysaccharide biosynthesis protein PslH
MKILWASPNLLHPTTKGGQIRTLEILRRLHQRHEIHYVTFTDEDSSGIEQSREYCSRLHTVRRLLPEKTSARFAAQLVKGLFAEWPVAISRYHSPAMLRLIDSLLGPGSAERFDCAVCDFLAPASHFRDLKRCILFQHNVETMIWRRHAEHAADPLRRHYFQLQARRMSAYEGSACRSAGHVISVSAVDSQLMRSMFGVTRISETPTGVDVDYFAPPSSPPPVADLVFTGSMDYLPNIDGVTYFAREILPLIRQRRPDCSVVVAGRTPSPEILALARQDTKIQVTGTIPDIRPYLWGSAVSIVPLRVGGGTRLKIYESMAAKAAVVSTTVGAEGLSVHPPHDIRIADTPESFASQCVELLENRPERLRLAEAGWRMVSSECSWEQVTRRFEQILEAGPSVHPQP